MPAKPGKPFPTIDTNALMTTLTRLTPLRPVEPLLNHLIEQHHDAVIIIDSVTAQCRLYNNRALVLTGYSRQQLTHRRLDDLLPPEHIRLFQSARQALEPGMSQSFEDVPLITLSQSRRLVDITLTSISPPQARAFMIAARPVEIRQAKQAIAHEQTMRLEAAREMMHLLDEMPDGIWDEAAASAARFLNAAALAFYIENEQEDALLCEATCGLPEPLPQCLPVDYCPASETWVAGRPASTDPLTHAAQEAGLGSLVQRRLGEEEGARALLVVGYRSRAAYRRELPLIDIAGSLLTSLAERRLRDKAIINLGRAHHSQNVLLETIQRLVTCGLVIVDTEGTITTINEAARNLLGYTEKDALGRHFDDVLASRDNRLSMAVQRATDEGVSSEGEEVILISRAGLAVPVWLRVAAVWPGIDLDDSVLIIFDDRSQYKAMEAQSQRMEQLSFLGEMNAMFAHEIRNPLATISTGVQYLMQKTPADSPFQETLRDIQAESNKLVQLLEDILAVARPRAPEVTCTDMGSLVTVSLQRWRPRMERKGIDVQVSIEPNLPRVMGDPGELERVLTNLFTNAIQAMSGQPHRGTLVVNVRPVAADPAGVGWQGARVRIDVGDTGPGMPPEIRKRVFDPFFTTKAGGTGLGLAIARRIITQHNGTFTVDSWEGVGTVFTITLPAAPECAAQEEGAPHERNDPPC